MFTETRWAVFAQPHMILLVEILFAELALAAIPSNLGVNRIPNRIKYKTFNKHK
jgi:hypothetical protein